MIPIVPCNAHTKVSRDVGMVSVKVRVRARARVSAGLNDSQCMLAQQRQTLQT